MNYLLPTSQVHYRGESQALSVTAAGPQGHWGTVFPSPYTEQHFYTSSQEPWGQADSQVTDGTHTASAWRGERSSEVRLVHTPGRVPEENSFNSATSDTMSLLLHHNTAPMWRSQHNWICNTTLNMSPFQGSVKSTSCSIKKGWMGRWSVGDRRVDGCLIGDRYVDRCQ